MGIILHAAAKVPWWKIALKVYGPKVAEAVAVMAGSKFIDKIMSDKEMSFEKKLERLNAALKDGTITQEEWQKARENLMNSYADQR